MSGSTMAPWMIAERRALDRAIRDHEESDHISALLGHGNSWWSRASGVLRDAGYVLVGRDDLAELIAERDGLFDALHRIKEASCAEPGLAQVHAIAVRAMDQIPTRTRFEAARNAIRHWPSWKRNTPPASCRKEKA